MTMKKSLIAIAVAGAVGAPLSAAQAAEAYGTVNLNLESSSIDNGGAVGATGNAIIFNNGDDDSGVTMNDVQQSRFGFRGEEDLGNGLTASYRLEYGFNADEEDGTFDKRLGWVALGGAFGQVKVGNMWGVLYQYSGYNTWSTCCYGGGAYYWTTSALNDDAYGLRVDNAVQYTYGAGAYGSDPFTFTIEAGFENQDVAASPGHDLNADGDFADNGESAPSAAVDDEESVDHISVGGQAAFAGFKVNAVHYTENNTQPSTGSAPEPSLTGIGGSWSSGPIYVGVNYHMLDLDLATNNREPSMFNVMANFDVGGGLNLMANVGTGDADTNSGNGDLTSFFFRVDQDLSSRTELYGELESATSDGIGTGGSDGETQVVTAGIRHSF